MYLLSLGIVSIYSLVVSERSDFLQQKKSQLVFRNEYRFTKEHSHTNLHDLLHTCLPIDCSKGGLIYCSPAHETKDHRQQGSIGNMAHRILLTQCLNKFQEEEIRGEWTLPHIRKFPLDQRFLLHTQK